MVMHITVQKMNMLFKSRLLLLMFLLTSTLLTATAVTAANITVTTSRNPVALDDSFHLIYEADSNVDGEPDFTPIYEHFDVLNSAQSTNMRYINGDYSLKKTWDLAMIAKDIGKFTIPAIAFGKDVSPAIQITVTNSSSPNSVSPDKQSTIPAKIFVESSIDKKQGYVQSQFIYTIRLLRTVSIASASLTEPETSDADAIIQALGEDSYQTTRNGIKYEVFERRYAIFPQKSGQLKIKPVTFEGRVNATQPRTIFDQFRMSGQLKRLRSQAVDVTVKAAPSAVNLQDWLPASDLHLFEEWSDDIQQIKAGEPVTRTITVAAEGLTAVQLPEINFTEIDGLKQYPDKPVTENKVDTNGITGVKQIKVALIPTSAGSYTIPEITLRWWNTKTNKPELATIPAVKLTATGSAPANIVVSDQPALPDNAPLATQDTSLQNIPIMTNNGPLQSLAPATADEPYWKWLSLFFAFAWLLTLVLLFKKSQLQKTQTRPGKDVSPSSIKPLITAVEKSAGKNDTNKTKIALIQWAQSSYASSTINNLSDITGLCSTQLAEEIRLLNQALYSSEKSSWNGRQLLIAFKNELALNKKRQEKHLSALKPLYQR